MKINEVEQAIGITKKNIRFYEQQGLLKPSRNLNNGYRDYSPEDITALRQIKLLRKLGIPIEDIKKLQNHYLTLEDCLRRHLISLERESKNLEAVQKFCHRLLSEDASLENMDVEQLLTDMDSMEEGGTRFVNIQKKDKRLLKRNALFAATVFILFMLMIIGLMLWATAQESIPLIILILFIGIPSVCIGGTLLALKERLKEIEGGELDEASKY
ncbi:MAG: MerR family transcriptional regulator [Lachnospiraceae bacterium]